MKIKRTRNIKIKGDLEAFSLEILRKLEIILKEQDYITEIKNRELEFKKRYRSSTNTGENNREVFKILRNGQFKFLPLPNGEIQLIFNVDLSHLLFMSIFFGVLVLLIGWIFTDYNLTFIGLLSFFATAILFIIGNLIIKIEIGDLINIIKE